MAIAASMSQEDSKDEHEHDLVMPGFRFHPTEEELIEFYLRRKVEGKRFNVELITFLDLYRYDPWELPALAAIGEKEWFFYVPRDRKYRNGDRPNRVTTSGYWKATGADRMIRTENFRAIGLKKTLVFYSGKAPKGIRTSWIMNEYRLPQHETERLQKAEISLCRVYKRAGVEDHPSVPRSISSRASSSSSSRGANSIKKPQETTNDVMDKIHVYGSQSHQVLEEKMSETSGSSIVTSDVGTSLGLSNQNSYIALPQISTPLEANPTSVDDGRVLLHQPSTTVFSVDDLHRLVNCQQHQAPVMNHQQSYHSMQNQASQFGAFQPSSHPLAGNMPPSSLPTAFSDRPLWDWSSLNDTSKEFSSPYK